MYNLNHTQHLRARTGPRVENRVPQFNKDYCGYDCGEGCKPYDVGSIESDTSSTLVNENGTQAVGRSTHGHSETSFLSGNGSTDTRDGSLSSARLSQYYHESLEGPHNFMSSGTRSVRSYGSRSVGTVSPSVLIGTGGWVTENGLLQGIDHGHGRLPLEYYFLERPLRLSPQDGPYGGRAESP